MGFSAANFSADERERAGRDEEALVAASVVDRSQKLLELGRADQALLVILALDDGDSPSRREAEGRRPRRPSRRLSRLRNRASRRARRRTPRMTRGESEASWASFRSARRACWIRFSISSRAARIVDPQARALHPRTAPISSAAACEQITIDLEEGVVDRVVQPRPLGAGQLVVVAPEDGVLRGARSRRQARRAEVIAGASSCVRGRLPEQALRAARLGRDRAAVRPASLRLEPVQNHRGTLWSQALHHSASPV